MPASNRGQEGPSLCLLLCRVRMGKVSNAVVARGEAENRAQHRGAVLKPCERCAPGERPRAPDGARPAHAAEQLAEATEMMERGDGEEILYRDSGTMRSAALPLPLAPY